MPLRMSRLISSRPILSRPISLHLALAAIFLVLPLVGNASAQDSPPLLEPGFEFRKIATDCKFTEGPAVDRDGNLYFSDGPNDRIMRRTPAGDVSVFLSPCGVANGLFVDAANRLVMCQSSSPVGGRAVAVANIETGKIENGKVENGKIENGKIATGKIKILTDKFEGERYISPNDLCVDRKGRVYFTDPHYSGERSQPTSGVYRLDPDGSVTLLIANLLKPNGIIMTPDNFMRKKK